MDTATLTAQAPTATQVDQLNAGWHNVVTAALGLNPATFQIAQGVLGLDTTDSSALFLMSDAVPPATAVNYYDAGGLSKRSSAYNLLLESLKPSSGSGLRGALGNNYAAWVLYRKANKPAAGQTALQFFDGWADANLDPGDAVAAKTAFLKAQADPLVKALSALIDGANLQQFVDAAGNPYSLYRYSAQSSNAVTAINGGGSATIDFDSAKMSTSTNKAWAKGAASGFYEIFSAGAGVNFSSLSARAASERFTVKGVINKTATLATQPIGWFDSGEFSRAYNAPNDYTVWDQNANQGGWDAFFKQPDGSLARRVSELVLVSDYSITVTSHASYSAAEFSQIQSSATFGVWPFFSAKTSGGASQSMTRGANGELSVTYTLAKGLIQIWGVNVQNAPQ